MPNIQRHAAGGSSLEDAAKAAGTTATTGTYATYVDPDAEKTDDSDKKSDDLKLECILSL